MNIIIQTERELSKSVKICDRLSEKGAYGAITKLEI